MMDSSILLLIIRILHIIGYTLGFSISFSLMLFYILIRKNSNLLDSMKLIRILIVFQITSNSISAFSGIFRLNYSSILQEPSKRIIFIPKMVIFSLSVITIFFLLFWFSKLISLLAFQPERKNSLTIKQDKITIFLLIINMLLISLTLSLGGSLVIF